MKLQLNRPETSVVGARLEALTTRENDFKNMLQDVSLCRLLGASVESRIEQLPPIIQNLKCRIHNYVTSCIFCSFDIFFNMQIISELLKDDLLALQTKNKFQTVNIRTVGSSRHNKIPMLLQSRFKQGY